MPPIYETWEEACIDLPDDWAEQVFSWLWDNDQTAVESYDDQGGRPSDEEIEEACDALGFEREDDEYS